ncbi:MAG TPA: hypothetical protein VK853_02030 [Ilumatobacteraceae bacterium]|nr:hypothetical protein [Ilumatobacteraceae bacterium]
MRTSSRPLRFAAALVALGLTAAACGGSDGTDADTAAVVTSPASETTTGDTAATETPTDDTTQAPVDTAAPAPSDSQAPDEPVAVPAALQFTAPLVGGGEFDGATVADKPTLFWFWAPT